MLLTGAERMQGSGKISCRNDEWAEAVGLGMTVMGIS